MARVTLDMGDDLLKKVDDKISKKYGKLIKRNAALRDILENWINRN